MSEFSEIDLRKMDIAHRLLREVSGSQSSIAPVYGDSPNLPDTFFVDSGNGDDNNDGRDPGFPMATIDAAIGRCTVSQGDVILVQPGHSETLDTVITLDVIGVSVIGIGRGNLRPMITQDVAGDGITITAVNCRIENLYFNEATTAPAGGGAAVNIAADFTIVKDIHFDLGTNDLEAITIESGASITIDGVEFNVTADGPDAAIEIESTVDLLTVKNCLLDGGSTTNAWDIGGINSGQVHTRCLIENNILLFGKSAVGMIEFSAAATGIIRNNVVGNGTLGAMIDPGSCMCFNNYEQDAVDETGGLFPDINPAASVGGGAHGGIDDATTDSLHGKLGADASEWADRSLWDLLEGDGPNSWPTAAAYANDVSLFEVIAYIQDGLRKGTGTALGADESLADVLYATKGIVGSWPAGTVQSGTGVSLAAGIRYTSENLRTLTGAFIPGMGVAVVRTKSADVHDGNTTSIFTVGTGRVLITGLFAEVMDAAVASGATKNLKFTANPTVGSAGDLCANLDIENDVEGAMYAISGPAATALLGGVADAVRLMPTGGRGTIVNAGVIEAVSSADSSSGGSTIQVTLYYIPIDSGATVVVA